MDAPWPRRRGLEKRVLKPLLATVGAAFAVGIGYMDPGNWATDLDATRYGNSLLWSIVASGIAAIVLQVLVVRFATTSSVGLIEAIAARFPAAYVTLWTVYALSIVATELAEFVGLVIGLEMVVRVGLPVAIALAVAILAAMLLAGGAAARRFEVLAIVTTAVLALVYAFEMGVLAPSAGAIVHGAIVPQIASAGALLAVVGIVGATIMPHNLFLQAGLVQKSLDESPTYARAVLAKRAIVATVGTLAIATLINIAIAVVGSATHADTIERAFRTLRPVAGPAAAVLFGVALIAAALAASVSAACAGDMICSSAAPLRLRRFDRRLIAIGPRRAAACVRGVACNIARSIANRVGDRVARGRHSAHSHRSRSALSPDARRPRATRCFHRRHCRHVRVRRFRSRFTTTTSLRSHRVRSQ